jgi:acyl carrier protein
VEVEQSEVDKIIREVFSTILKREVKRGEAVSREKESRWDSLKHIELIFMLEERLGVRFNESQMVELGSLEETVKCVMDKYET